MRRVRSRVNAFVHGRTRDEVVRRLLLVHILGRRGDRRQQRLRGDHTQMHRRRARLRVTAPRRAPYSHATAATAYGVHR